MSEYLFAYGTLQPKCAPATMAPLVAKMRAVGEGFVHGALYDLGGYPGAVPDAHANSKIMGTVMELPGDEDVLQQLDAYEGIDPEAPAASEYIRERQTVQTVTGETLECWFYRYLWKPDPARAIESGAWSRSRDHGSGNRDQ